MARVPKEQAPEAPEDEIRIAPPPDSERDTVAPSMEAPEQEPEKEEKERMRFPLGGRKRAERDKVEPKRGPGRPKGSTSIAKLRTGLIQQFTLIGIGVTAFNPYDGKVILTNAEGLADNLCKVAEQNPAVRRALEGLLVAGVWSGLALSAAAIAVPIMANHKLLPAQLALLMGADDPRQEQQEGQLEPIDLAAQRQNP